MMISSFSSTRALASWSCSMRAFTFVLFSPSRLANHKSTFLDSSSSSSTFSTQSNKEGGVDAMGLEGGGVTDVAFAMRHVDQKGTFSLGDSNNEDGEEDEVAMATLDTPR